MKSLPNLVATCTVPRLFSPSQLAVGDTCLLRVVLNSSHELPALTTHPAAVLGRVFHRLIEMAVRGEIAPHEGAVRDAEAALERLLDDEDARLERECPGDPPRLRAIFPPLIWRRKRRSVLDLAVRYLDGALPRASTLYVDRHRDATIFATKSGKRSEFPLAVEELRLAGRVDMFEWHDKELLIRDLKTGRVVTFDGVVLPHIEMQLRLYGLIARKLWPEAHVTLIVDDGTERLISFDASEEQATEEWLRGALERLPSGAAVSAESLGNPGNVCEGCSHRHVCPSYQAAAPEYWKTTAPVRLPLDIWGEIISVREAASGVELAVRDAAGRAIKIFGLASVSYGDICTCDSFWAFGLQTRDRRGGPDQWHHPRNFFEVADDDPHMRAWTLSVFGS